MMESTYAAVMELRIDVGEMMRGSMQAAVACLATLAGQYPQAAGDNLLDRNKYISRLPNQSRNKFIPKYCDLRLMILLLP